MNMTVPRGAITDEETFIPAGLPLPALVSLSHAGVELHHHFVGDSYVKVTKLKARQSLVQHRHKIAHVSMLLVGKVTLHTLDPARGGAIAIDAPWVGKIPAHTYHQVDAIEDSLWACIWSNPDGLLDPDEIDRQVAEP